MGIKINKNKKLAVGIPTYKRPDFAIKLIKEIISLEIYDQIIISSNSNEKQLTDFINSINSSKIIFNQQSKNVGMAKNYFDIIKLCECEYLHMISDEDSVYHENLRALYKEICQNHNYSLIIVSVNTIDNKVYKDASWQKNTYLKDSLGETAHFGSSIINRKMIDKKMLKNLYEYAKTKSSVYPTTAAALAAYSGFGKIYYFRKPIVKMGTHHNFSEISGPSTYGFEVRLHQYMSLFSFFQKIKLKNKLIIGLYGIYYFTHHALQDAVRKYNNKPSTEFINFYKRYSFKPIDKKIAFLILINAFYFFYYYFKLRINLSRLIKPLFKKKF